MVRIPEHLIDRIRESVDIVDVISRYISLKKQGKNYKALCPFHTEKTPSFTVNSDKGIFYCFGCHAGGNVFNFLMRYEKISFIEAVKNLAEEAGIELPRQDQRNDWEQSEYDRQFRANQFAAKFYHQLLAEHPNLISGYLAERGITPETVEFFKIGYVPDGWDVLHKEIQGKKLGVDIFMKIGLILQSEKDTSRKYDRFRNRLMFPIQNLSGKVVGFGGRTLGNEPNTPKYLNSPESLVYKKSEILYGLFYAKDWIRKEEHAIFVEGYMDYLQLFQAGIKNIVATSGTALTEEHAKLIRRYTQNVILCYDADSAGINAAIRGGQILFQQNLNTRVLLLPEGEDPDSFVKSNGASAFYALSEKAQDYFRFRINRVLKVLESGKVGDRAVRVGELLDTLATHPDPIKRNFYLKEFAQQFALDEQMLTSELKKRIATFTSREKRRVEHPREPKTAGTQITVFSGAWSAEKDILSLLLSNLEAIKPLIFKYLQPEDFLNEELRTIFIEIKNSPGKTGDELFHHILSGITNEEVRGLVTANLLQEIQHPVRYLNDCIQKIKLARYRNELERLRAELKQTSSTDPRYSTILQKINDCQRQKQQINKIFSNS